MKNFKVWPTCVGGTQGQPVGTSAQGQLNKRSGGGPGTYNFAHLVVWPSSPSNLGNNKPVASTLEC